MLSKGIEEERRTAMSEEKAMKELLQRAICSGVAESERHFKSLFRPYYRSSTQVGKMLDWIEEILVDTDRIQEEKGFIPLRDMPLYIREVVTGIVDMMLSQNLLEAERLSYNEELNNSNSWFAYMEGQIARTQLLNGEPCYFYEVEPGLLKLMMSPSSWTVRPEGTLSIDHLGVTHIYWLTEEEVEDIYEEDWFTR
jgi:hypothetical protein